jgi:hypothetical protein
MGNLIVLLIALIALSDQSVASAQNCPTGGTTVFYGNGVLTTPERAQATLAQLRLAIDAALDQRAPTRDPACVKYQLAYDSLFFDGSGVIASVGNFILQLITAAIQAGVTTTNLAWTDAYRGSDTIPSLPDGWDSPAVTDKYVSLNSIVSLVQPDVQQHRSAYQAELDAGNNVVVVAHSQGNFYVNQAYGLIGLPPTLQFGTVAVATPASDVAGGGPWVTLINDIIRLVPTAKPSNAANSNHPDRCNSSVNLASRTRCHDMNRSYVSGDVTGPLIINAVVNRIVSDVTVTKDGSGTGTVVSDPSGIDCGARCTASFYSGSTISLTATADSGSIFSGWSGDCTGSQATTSLDLTETRSCGARFTMLPAVAVNPFGNQTLATAPGPYLVRIVDAALNVEAAEADVTVTIHREVVSACRGTIFSSNLISVIPTGQMSASYASAGNVAGRDPFCNTLPITTTFTIMGATMAPDNVPLDLSIAPAIQRSLSVVR